MISKELKFLLTHSSIYGLGTVVSRMVAFILLPLYTRYLTPADYGLLEAIDISTAVIGIVVTVGIAMALSRFYYESEEMEQRNRVVSTTYVTYSIIAVFCLPLLFYLSSPLSQVLFDTQDYSSFFRISFGSLLLGGIIDIGVMYLRLIKKPLVFITVTTSRLTLLIVLNIIFIVFFKMGVLGILYSSLIVKAFYAVLITAPILWKTKVRVSMKLSLAMLKYSLPIIPSRLANTIVKQSDKYFVLYFISIADMGIYGLALKLGNAVHNLLTIPFNMAYIPRRFEIMKNHEAKEIYSKVFTYYIFVMVYVGLAISLLIPEILQLMVTPKFFPAGKFVPLVVFSMIIFGCHYHFNFGILYSKKTKYLAYIDLSSASVSLVLNIFLIRAYGLWGAVYSSVIALTFQALLLYYVSNRLYRIEFEFGRLFSYLLTAGTFCFLIRQIKVDMLALDVAIKVLFLMLFPLFLILLRIISSEETRELRSFFARRLKPLLFKDKAFRTS